MEQHKVLLIIVSVAIVLAAVVGVGLWLFYPRDDAETSITESELPGSGGFEWQPLDFLQGDGDVPGLDPGEDTGDPDEFEVTYGVLPETESTGSRGTGPVIETSQPATGDGQPAMVMSDDPSAVADAGAPRSDSSAGSTGSPAVARGSDPTAGTAAPVASAETTSRDTMSAVPGGLTGESSLELAQQAYWVQAISSPNRDTVEQARQTLRDHQLGSRILTREIDGRTYFRLRVGPFAVRTEAEKFLGWVRDISGFADAMIFVDYTTPVLAARPQ